MPFRHLDIFKNHSRLLIDSSIASRYSLKIKHAEWYIACLGKMGN